MEMHPIRTKIQFTREADPNLANIRGVINAYHNANCSDIYFHTPPNFRRIKQFNPNIHIICFPIALQNENFNCDCLYKRGCSSILLSEQLGIQNAPCLSNKTVVTVESSRMPFIYDAISTVDLPSIKPIQISHKTTIVFGIMAIGFLFFLVILSISFDVYVPLPMMEYKMRHPLSKTQLNILFPPLSLQSPTSDDCPICMNVYSSEDQLRVLACGHRFHCTCIDQWIVGYKAQCPICKSAVWRCPRAV